MREHRIVYEEVPGSRTTQETVIDPQRQRIAYEELQPGDIIQEGDEWQNECGRWQPFLVLDGSRVQVRQSQRVRRPYSITAMQHERDELRAEMDTVKGDRMNLREALTAEQRAHKCTMTNGLGACKERDEARAELANAREEIQNLLKTITDNADQFANTGKILEQERDEAQAELKRVQEVIINLYSEPTARQVQDMLRTWATELDWSAGCFDSVAREQIDGIQKTLIAVMERIETMIHPEGGSDGE